MSQWSAGSCGHLDRPNHFSVPQFPYLQSKTNSNYLLLLLGEIKLDNTCNVSSFMLGQSRCF
jgi:hypothetical protein